MLNLKSEFLNSNISKFCFCNFVSNFNFLVSSYLEFVNEILNNFNFLSSKLFKSKLESIPLEINRHKSTSDIL